MSDINKFEEFVDVIKGKTLAERLRALRAQNIPVLTLGPPGVGKSSAVVQILEKDDYFRDVRASQMDPVDAAGLPYIEQLASASQLMLNQLAFTERHGTAEEKKRVLDEARDFFARAEAARNMGSGSAAVHWARPSFLPPLGWNGRGVIHFDELNTASTAVQNTLLQPFGAPPGHPRMIGTHVIQPGIWLCASGNRAEDAAHVTPMAAPLRNRFHILVAEPDLRAWTVWATQNDVHPNVIAFLNFRSEFLYQKPVDEYSAFPTPRSWSEQVSPLLKQGIGGIQALEGAVGKAAATEFMSYVKELQHMPNIHNLLTGKDPWDPSKYTNSIIYAVMIELVLRCMKEPKYIGAAMKIAEACKPEHTAVYVSSLCRSDDQQLLVQVINEQSLRDWAKKHTHLIRAR